MNTTLKAPPTVRFENRFPADEELTEGERSTRRERTRRAAAVDEAFRASGGERVIHRTPERLAAASARSRQRLEALRAESKEDTSENLYRPEPNFT